MTIAAAVADLAKKFTATVAKECDVDNAYEYTYRAICDLGFIKICGRCGGEGVLHSFKHVQAGVCFKCEGVGTLRVHLPVAKVRDMIEAEPELLFKKVRLQLKREARKQQKEIEKFNKLVAERVANRKASLALLSEQDANDFTNFIQQIENKAADWRSKIYDDEGRQIDLLDNHTNHPWMRLSPFQKDIAEKFYSKGTLSEKQMLAFLKSVRSEIEKDEKLAQAETFEADKKYCVKAVVTKMEKEATSFGWQATYTTKIVLRGELGEVFVVKTNNKNLLEKFTKSLDEKTAINVDATCKWVAPTGFPVVFTARGMKVEEK